MSVQIELVAVHVLVQRGTAEARAEALRRLDALPGWLDDPAASHWRSQERLQRARVLLATGDRQGAWRSLRRAAQAAERTASSHWLGITMHQVGLLAGQGDISRAVQRLRAALDECEMAPCHASLVQHARGQLAWHIPHRADVSDGELGRAAEMLERAADDAVDDPPEAAGHRINLAWVLLRRGDPADVGRIDAALAAARGALAAAPPSERVTVLGGWADVIGASASLARRAGGVDGDVLEGAVATCAPWTSSPDAELAAWASACVARAARRRGDLVTAADFFDLALLHHEHLRLGAEQTRAPMGPGERADLFYRAARVAAERGDAARAWGVLSRLDALAPGLEERRRCRDAASADALDAWRALDAEAAELFTRLARLDGSVAGAAARIRRAQQRAAKQRLREIFESRPGCRPPAPERSGADVKLFALGDEVWGLWRAGDGF
ncbi:MAG: hypothetical protein AAFX50_17985, partial [Acidobacteriota bacterium]